MLAFQGKLLSGVTEYVELPVGPLGRLFIDVQWVDAVSSATLTMETTGTPEVASVVGQKTSSFRIAGNAWDWKLESGVTITGPTAAAASSTKVHISNLCCSRARLKIVTAAACDFIIYTETQ